MHTKHIHVIRKRRYFRRK